MTRYLALALLLIAPFLAADSIYRTTDKEGNVVFTDAPSADSGTAEPVGLQRTNTTPPPPDRPDLERDEDSADAGAEETPYSVTITSPANETSFPMGPGNFTVSVRIQPALRKYESLQLFLDGEPRGGPQASMIWDLTNVFRGAHDITVGVVNRDGETLATSPPVRVYVHRPSINFPNRQ
jgi:hypothetical protein